jgi:hypothetical protein
MPSLSGDSYQQLDYPYWPRATAPAGAEATGPLLAGIRELQFFWPSPLYIDTKQVTDAAVTAVSAAMTIETSAPFDTNPLTFKPNLGSSGIGRSSFVLAARSAAAGRIVVVADELLPSSMNGYLAQSDNTVFTVNVADWISGYESLSSLRRQSGGLSGSYVPVVKRGRDIAFAINVIVVPAVVLLAFLVARVARRRKR